MTPSSSSADGERRHASIAEAGPADVHYRCTEFLNREAELLDTWNMREWFNLVTDDIAYRVPVRITKEAGADEFSEMSTHFKETKASLDMRIRRFESEYAWSENPPSRIRHFVSNVRVDEVDGNEVVVKSNLLLTRSQLDNTNYDLITCERHDRLREVDGELKLARRDAYLDHTVTDIEYISTFL